MRKLLEFRRSPNCVKVRIALRLKGLDFQAVEVAAADRAPLIAAAGWPLVPVLVDGDFGIGDSEAILLYLDAKYREPSLAIHDADTLKAAQTFRLTVQTHLAQLRPQLIAQRERAPGERDWAVLADLQARASTLAMLFEERLSRHANLFGPQLTTYDIICGCSIMAMRPPVEFVRESPFWQTFAGLITLPVQCERTRVWYDALIAHDGLSATASA